MTDHYITTFNVKGLHVSAIACRCGSLFVTDGRTGLTADHQYANHLRREVQR